MATSQPYGKRQRDAATDSRSTAGDQRHFILQQIAFKHVVAFFQSSGFNFCERVAKLT
jgi:hypothetical protein